MPPAPPMDIKMVASMKAFLLASAVHNIIAPGKILEDKTRNPFAADSILELLRPLDLPIPQPGSGDISLPLPAIPPAAKALIDSLPKDRIPVAVAVGTNMPSKRWPLERYAQTLSLLAAKHNCHPVFFGGPEDRDAINAASKDIPSTKVIGQDFPTVASIMGHCHFYLGNDTGLMHLAAAAGLPCVALFSARAIPGLWEPYGSNHKVLVTHTECEGCNQFDCKTPGHPCLLNTTVNQVVTACIETIKGA